MAEDRRAFLALSSIGVAGAMMSRQTTSQISEPEAQARENAKALIEATEAALKSLEQQLPQITELPTPQFEEFGRNNNDQIAWEQVTQQLAADLKLTRPDAQDALALSLLRIEAGYSFQAQPQDAAFSPFHIEPLLDQAADLLDRALKDRSIADDIAAKMASQMLELHESKELDAIHAEEEQAGFYDVPWKQSSADLKAEESSLHFQSFQLKLMEWLWDNYFSNAQLAELYDAYRRGGWLTTLPPYLAPGAGIDWPKFAWHGYHESGNQTPSQHAIDVADIHGRHTIGAELAATRVQEQQVRQQGAVHEARIPALRAKAEWDQANAAFQRRRTLVARKYQDIKSRIATDPQGVLNYARRLPAIQKRFHQDLRNANARLIVLAQGLKDIYGYDEELPADDKSIDYYDDCLVWTRRAIEWLICFSRQDQAFVLPVSLKTKFGSAAWSQALSAGNLDFTLSAADFEGLAHTRLRGISATIEAGGSKKLWQLLVQVPKQASIKHLSGEVKVLDQTKVPPCRMARVTARESLREPDIVGAVALHNTSPIGTWHVTIAGASPPAAAADLTQIQDILIDLQLVFRAG